GQRRDAAKGDHREYRDRPRAVPPVHEDQENEERLESGDRQDRGSAEGAEGAPADPDEQFDDEAEHEDAVDRDVLRFIEHRLPPHNRYSSGKRKIQTASTIPQEIPNTST